MREPLKFLFKYPCRGRERLFFESLDSLHKNIRDKNNFHISINLDVDDTILNRPEVIERIYDYPDTSIEWGYSKSKVDAINRSMSDYDYDVLFCWSNDMVADVYSFDDIMRDYMYHIINQYSDEFLVHFPEPDSKDFLNVLYIASKKYYERFGYIYHPSYKSLWCDNESMAVAKLLGKYHYVGIPGLYSHKNPAYSQYGIERDELFNEQQGHWQEDEANFNARKEKDFDLQFINGIWHTKAIEVK